MTLDTHLSVSGVGSVSPPERPRYRQTRPREEIIAKTGGWYRRELVYDQVTLFVVFFVLLLACRRWPLLAALLASWSVSQSAELCKILVF